MAHPCFCFVNTCRNTGIISWVIRRKISDGRGLCSRRAERLKRGGIPRPNNLRTGKRSMPNVQLRPHCAFAASALSAGLGCNTLRRPWPPPIPTKPCFNCGGLTNETQSIFGVGHDWCFRNAHVRPNVKLRGAALYQRPARTESYGFILTKGSETWNK